MPASQPPPPAAKPSPPPQGHQQMMDIGRYFERSQRQIEEDGLPSNDLAAYYSDDPPSSPPPGPGGAAEEEPELYDLHTRLAGNRGIKRSRGARFQRTSAAGGGAGGRGKLAAWNTTYGAVVEDQRVKKRLRVALDVVMPSAAEEAGVIVDPLTAAAAFGAQGKEESCGLAHLRDISPPPTEHEIAESLREGNLTTYLSLVTSPAVRNTLGEASKERALMRTVDELVDGENPLVKVLGRFKAEVQAAIGRAGGSTTTTTAAAAAGRARRARRDNKGEINGSIVPDPQREESPTTTPAAAEDGPEIQDVKKEQTASSSPVVVADKAQEKSTAAAAAGRTASASESLSGWTQQQRQQQQQQQQKPALDSNFLFGSGEPFMVPPGSMVTYEPVVQPDPSTGSGSGSGSGNVGGGGGGSAGGEDPEIIDVYPSIELTPLQQLFVTPTGLTTTIGPSPNDPRLGLPTHHPGYPHTTVVRLTPETQKHSVTAALEKIHELASDVAEYVARLQEIRERIANIARARRRVWAIVRERAVLENGGQVGDGEADSETMKLRAEAEQAISGAGTVETRRRRGVATAVASSVAS
ncbi:hypothetical protein QFC19_008009 [Naganishia cerealis]|uniref:Uncharacterized protein n=1 Tax=Naganishia cerealis TaxID=610337 RepID=A0ACC2V5D0_9TREE|nr:hypothetical protein QFC19_008009 [Naganishia cerealis]